MNKIDTKSLVFSWLGKPTPVEIVPLSLQHVAAMVVGCVTPAIIVSNICGLSPADSVILIQSALIISGLATLVQLFPVFGKVGSGLPVIMGASFAYLPTLISIGSEFNLATILGAQLIGGAVAVVFGIFVKYLRKLFPPLVTGTVVFTIGLSLYPTAIKYMAGGASAPDFGAPIYWIISLITLAVVIILNNFAKGFLRLASILIGIAVGYIISLFCGIVSFDAVATAGWVTVPAPLHFGLEFHTSAIITMAVLYIVNSVQAIGDLSATTAGGFDRSPKIGELSGGIIGNGLASMLGAFFGGLPTATYSQNVGIVATTKVVNRLIFTVAAVLILLAGFLPKFSALLTTIPSCVLGGATISVFASITMTGIRLIMQQGLSMKNSGIVGLSIALGLGITQVEGCLDQFPAWVGSIFGDSPVIVATLVAIILYLVIPKEESDVLPDEAVQEAEAHAELEEEISEEVK